MVYESVRYYEMSKCKMHIILSELNEVKHKKNPNLRYRLGGLTLGSSDRTKPQIIGTCYG